MPASGPDDLEAFCRAEYPRLVGALSLYCGDALAAEELAQEALERACLRWPQVAQMAAPGAWIHRVAINLATSRFRRRAAERRAYARLPAADQTYEMQASVDETGLLSCLQQLPVRERAILILRYYADLDVATCASLLGLRDVAVRSLSHRALVRLRSIFPERVERDVL